MASDRVNFRANPHSTVYGIDIPSLLVWILLLCQVEICDMKAGGSEAAGIELLMTP
jgi:hypothetical protein